jgi:hypothetical protein
VNSDASADGMVEAVSSGVELLVLSSKILTYWLVDCQQVRVVKELVFVMVTGGEP